MSIETSPAAAPTLFVPGQYTVATLPSALVYTRMYAWVTDLFGGPGDYCISNGTDWRPVRPFSLSSVPGNVDRTLTALVDAPTMVMTGALTAIRSLTLSPTNAYRGATFRIKREASGLSALLVNGVGLSLNSWVDMEYDGSAWVQTASGGLL